MLKTLRKVYSYMGENAFRMSGGNTGRKAPITMSVFETVMYVFASVDELQEDLYGEIKEMVDQFINGEAFRKNIRNHKDSPARLSW